MISRQTREPSTVKEVADRLGTNITLSTDTDNLMWFNPRTTDNHNLYVETADGDERIAYTIAPEVEFKPNPEWSDNTGRLTVTVSLYTGDGFEMQTEEITEQYIENQGMVNIIFMNRLNWENKIQEVAEEMAEYAEFLVEEDEHY